MRSTAGQGGAKQVAGAAAEMKDLRAGNSTERALTSTSRPMMASSSALLLHSPMARMSESNSRDHACTFLACAMTAVEISRVAEAAAAPQRFASRCARPTVSLVPCSVSPSAPHRSDPHSSKQVWRCQSAMLLSMCRTIGLPGMLHLHAVGRFRRLSFRHCDCNHLQRLTTERERDAQRQRPRDRCRDASAQFGASPVPPRSTQQQSRQTSHCRSAVPCRRSAPGADCPHVLRFCQPCVGRSAMLPCIMAGQCAQHC